MIQCFHLNLVSKLIKLKCIKLRNEILKIIIIYVASGCTKFYGMTFEIFWNFCFLVKIHKYIILEVAI